jgi:hypothetical protein
MIRPMRPLELTAALTAFERRGPGTDAERRAARWLARSLYTAGRRVRVEAFWCRPNWALAHAWHVALALAGSLLSVSHPTLGAALLAAALIAILADALTGISPGRRLTPERASQNVIAKPDDNANNTTTLILTANYDAGRVALAYRDPLRRPAAALRRLAGPLALGWLAWLCLAIGWLLAIAVIRIAVQHPPAILGAIQLAPSVALVLALALLLEAAGAGYGPAARDNASGTAVAIALVRALDAAPPRNLAVELVLQGAGEGQEIGIRRYLRARRKELRPENAIVLGISAAGAGQPHWWQSDGRLFPLPYAPRLRALCGQTSASPHRGRGATPALPARTAGLPAIAIGCLDCRGLPTSSHQKADTPERIDDTALDRALETGLTLIKAIDAALARDPAKQPRAATPA